MAVIPLLPGGAQDWVADFHEGVISAWESDTTDVQVSRPTSTPRPTAASQSTRTLRPANTPGLTATPLLTPSPRPNSTPSPAPTPLPPLTSGPATTAVPTPIPKPTPTPTSTPMPRLTPTSVLPSLRQYALELINNDRAAHGLTPVVLGSNIAAQHHAQDMLEYDYLATGGPMAASRIWCTHWQEEGATYRRTRRQAGLRNVSGGRTIATPSW